MSEELAGLLAEELGATIEKLTRLSAGASRETWAFEADGEPLVLQRSRFSLSGGVDEPALLRHAHAGGVRVPEIVASSSGADHPIGAQFTVAKRLAGESIARKILRDDEFAGAREAFVADCARELVAIHALDPEPMMGALPTVVDPVAAQWATYEMLGDPHPVFDLAFRWLVDNRPPARASRVVHGDFRMGNFLIGPHGMTAVLDWELSHLGDPVEDLGWLVARAWRFGGHGEVGGLGSREELIEAYRAAGGANVSLEELSWWEVLASLRWGVITMFMGNEHRSGSTRSLEHATIGRRVVETEYDVMLLLLPELGGMSDRSVPAAPLALDAPRPRTNWPHDVPDGRELVEAVRDYLRDDLGPRADGRDRFLLRVAANALSIAARELAAQPVDAAAHTERLAALGVDSEAALCAAIREGRLDARRSELADALWAATLVKLAVANPKYRDGSLEP